MSEFRVAVVGSGSREHALASTLSREANVIVIGGNAGMRFPRVAMAEQVNADLYVVGPEQPLVDGLADELRKAGKLVLGPGADGARLEGSKAWMKEVAEAAGVPSADFFVVRTLAQAEFALRELRRRGYPGFAVKTDGLAAGKGVLVTDSEEEAMADVRAKLSGEAFGDAGKTLVIEGLLANKRTGKAYEVSLFAICNGTDYVLLEGAQDYKALALGSSINTGGTGAYSPTRDQYLLEAWAELTIKPLLAELNRRGIDYRGFLYAGLMIVDGQPYLLEYNIRFGDPEAQVVLPRIMGSFLPTLMQAAAGARMDPVQFTDDYAIGTVLMSRGYPTDVEDGFVIRGIEAALKVPDTEIFYGGVARDDEDQLITKGGRVLTVVTRGSNPAVVKSHNNKAAALVHFEGKHSRPDIGNELLDAA